MNRILITLAIAATLAQPLPVLAQETPPDSGSSKIEQGFRQLLEGLSDGIGSATEDAGPALKNFLDKMGPAFRDIIAQIKDFSDYEAPQVLPNGDILIRRKQQAPDYMPPVPGENPDGSVDL